MKDLKDSEERKNEFIDVAEKLFKENGIVDTTVNAIVKDMNVAKGLFYYYFKSKDDVIDAISEKYNEIFNEMMQEKMDQPTYDERLQQFIENCVRSFRKLNEHLNGQENADLTALVNKSKQEAMKVSFDGLTQLFIEGNELEELDISAPRQYSEILISGINTLVEGNLTSDEDIVDMIMKLIASSRKVK